MAIDIANSTDNRNERLLGWAREHGEEFHGKQAADMLGVKPQGIGPVLASLVRSGDLTVNYHGSKRYYRLDEEQAVPGSETGGINVEDHMSDFEGNLKTELGNHLTHLRTVDEQLATRRAEIAASIARIEAGLKELA